jgi:hypothetical protein
LNKRVTCAQGDLDKINSLAKYQLGLIVKVREGINFSETTLKTLKTINEGPQIGDQLLLLSANAKQARARFGVFSCDKRVRDEPR